MPQAAMAPIALGLSAAGTGSSMAQGKGGKDAANQQLQMQRQQMMYGHNITDQGMAAWTPAANYYKALLSGDRGAVSQAIGPTSQMIRQGGTAQLGQLANSLPAGGERNLALAQSRMGTYNQLGNLYAGVQPAAASALGQLSQIPINAGMQAQGQARPDVGAGMGYYDQQNRQAGAGMAGLGSLLYGIGRYGWNMGQWPSTGGGSGSGKGQTHSDGGGKG